LYKIGINKKTRAENVGIGGEATGDTLPIGATIEWHSDIIPENWLLCDGREVSRTGYPELFKVLGIKYGTGDGSTTFNLPNLKGKVVVGKDEEDTDFNKLGKTGGEKEHTLTIEEIPSHTHGIKNLKRATLNYNGDASIPSDGSSEWTPQTQATGGGQPHNNKQPYLVCNFIIKAKQSSGLVATVVDNLNSESETDALSAGQGKILNERTSKKILWENTTNLNTFDAQEITLNSSDYDYLIIYAYRNHTGDKKTVSCIVEKDKMCELIYFDIFGDDGVRAWRRTLEITNDKVKFEEASINGNANNNVLVPYKIIGCKY
jgi:microcystin-dependent protein